MVTSIMLETGIFTLEDAMAVLIFAREGRCALSCMLLLSVACEVAFTKLSGKLHATPLTGKNNQHQRRSSTSRGWRIKEVALGSWD